MYIVFIIFLILNSCVVNAPNSTSPIQRPSNLLYVINGYGYDNRIYSRQNIDLMVKAHNINQIKHPLTKHEEYQNIANLMEKSVQFDSNNTEKNIKYYLDGYKEMLSDSNEEQILEDKTNTAYFNLNEYTKKRPSMNVAIVEYLSQDGIMPMTSQSSDLFYDYYFRNMQFTHNDLNGQFNVDANYKPSITNIEDRNINKKVIAPTDNTENELKKQLLNNNTTKYKKNKSEYLNHFY